MELVKRVRESARRAPPAFSLEGSADSNVWAGNGLGTNSWQRHKRSSRAVRDVAELWSGENQCPGHKPPNSMSSSVRAPSHSDSRRAPQIFEIGEKCEKKQTLITRYCMSLKRHQGELHLTGKSTICSTLQRMRKTLKTSLISTTTAGMSMFCSIGHQHTGKSTLSWARTTSSSSTNTTVNFLLEEVQDCWHFHHLLPSAEDDTKRCGILSEALRARESKCRSSAALPAAGSLPAAQGHVTSTVCPRCAAEPAPVAAPRREVSARRQATEVLRACSGGVVSGIPSSGAVRCGA